MTSNIIENVLVINQSRGRNKSEHFQPDIARAIDPKSDMSHIKYGTSSQAPPHMEPALKSFSTRAVPPAYGGTSATKWMSMVQLALGLTATVLFVVAVVVCRAVGILNVAVPIFFIVSGIFSAISVRKPTHTVILLAVVTSGFASALAATFFLYLVSYGSLVGQRRSYLSPMPTWEVLQGILMFICLVEGILSTIFSILACRILCSCCQLQVFLTSSEHSTVDFAPTAPAPSPFHRADTTNYRVGSGSDSSSVFFQYRNNPPPQYKEVA